MGRQACFALLPMALPPAAPHRQLRHRRSIDVQAFDRGDHTWDIDARIVDTKTRDALLGGETRTAGVPIHEMLLRLVVDEQLSILAAGSEMLHMPYTGLCNQHPDDDADPYGRLVGLNLRSGFREAVWQRLGGVKGCTHLTELTQLLPSAVIQAFAGDVFNVRESRDASGNEVRPFQLDRCHGLRLDGEAVRIYYPRWRRPALRVPESG